MKMESALAMQKENQGAQDPDTIETMLVMVGVRLGLNDNLVAESMAHEVYSRASSKFGDGSEITIESVFKLADAMQRQGKYTKAESALQTAYREVLHARYLSAWVAKRAFEEERAESEYRKLLVDQEKFLGPEDVQKKRSLRSFSDFLIKKGRGDEAELMLDEWQDRVTESLWDNEEILISREEEWLFLNQERDEGTAWNEDGPDRISSTEGPVWKEGVAPFGYGIPGLATKPLLVDGRHHHITHYFRRSFEVEDPARFSRLKIRLRGEGGAAVYFNGKEVIRDNLAENADFQQLSGPAESIDRYVSHVFLIDPELVREGRNVIAVEVHQEEINSADMVFDLELSGKLKTEVVE